MSASLVISCELRVMFAQTPPPPYYAVVFTSIRKNDDPDYDVMSTRMVELAKLQPGYLGHESARNEIGITVSYWKDLDSIRNWKMNSEHLLAQKKGREKFYANYKVRIAKVERDYEF